jgi:hypothetical protein
MLAEYSRQRLNYAKNAAAQKHSKPMKYIHAITFKDDDYEIATATTPEEVKQLGIAGFVKYDEMSGIHFYRKPKKFRSLYWNESKCSLLQWNNVY